jgi:hypothetical protein
MKRMAYGQMRVYYTLKTGPISTRPRSCRAANLGLVDAGRYLGHAYQVRFIPTLSKQQMVSHTNVNESAVR